jgi:hypothetical protein
VLNWVTHIYRNKSRIDSIKGISFATVELVIFLIAHENVTVGRFSSIKKALIDLPKGINAPRNKLYDLPAEYQGISYDDISKTANWLRLLPIEICSNQQFDDYLLVAIKDYNCHGYSEQLSSNSHQTVSVVNPLPEAISNIIEDIKDNMVEIEQQGINPSSMIINLRLYHQNDSTDSTDKLYPNRIDKNIFLNESIYKSAAEFTIERYGNLIFRE